MSVISKLLHRHEEALEQPVEEEDLRCPHTSLVPHWDDPATLGKPEFARYQCESCHEEFTYQQTEQLLHSTLPPQEPTPPPSEA